MPENHPGHDTDATHLLQVLAHRARHTPDAPAVLQPDQEPLTYATLHALVTAGIDRLTAAGVRRDDRVVVPAANDTDGVVALLAALCAAVCCPVDPELAQEELEAVFDVLEPTAILLAAGAPGRLTRAAASSDLVVLEHDGRLDGAGPAAGLMPAGRRLPRPVVGESALLRTSGTTAAGKIVPLTMSAMLAAARASARAYRLTPEDRRLNLSPLYYVQGLVGGLVTALVSGSSLACLPSFDPGQALRLLDEMAPTWFSASPMTHRVLLDAARGRVVRAPRLRFVRSGAAPMPPGLRREVERTFGVPLLESYGMSEASQISCTPLPQDGEARGMRPAGSEIGLLGADGVLRREPGAKGEIAVRGANVIERYVWPMEANSAFLGGGWLRTGDLGELAEDGSLVITGRAKELINRGGEKVTPSEVEDVLLTHPAVSRAVVFGVADGTSERVAAAVVPRPGQRVDERSLRTFAVARLAAFKVPERVLVRDDLPLSASGKLVRAELPELLGISFDDRPQPRAAGVLHAVPGPGDEGRLRRGSGARFTGGFAGAAARVAAASVAVAPAPRTAPVRGAAPCTPVQAALAGLWAYALGLERVGVDEDFFVLGGEPSSAVLLLTAVEETLGASLSIDGLFDELRTVERMAATIERLPRRV